MNPSGPTRSGGTARMKRLRSSSMGRLPERSSRAIVSTKNGSRHSTPSRSMSLTRRRMKLKEVGATAAPSMRRLSIASPGSACIRSSRRRVSGEGQESRCNEPLREREFLLVAERSLHLARPKRRICTKDPMEGRLVAGWSVDLIPTGEDQRHLVPVCGDDRGYIAASFEPRIEGQPVNLEQRVEA